MTVYFDNAATTRVRPEAAKAVLDTMTENYGNPSSTHSLGRTARNIMETARKNVAAAIGAESGEIYFTSGGTEADNWAILSAAEIGKHRGRHVITSQTEHDAVRRSFDELKKRGFDVTYLTPDPSGRITVEALREALREDTVLVSLMLVNNEVGAVNDIPAMMKLVRKTAPHALFHTDAVQALGKISFSVKSLGADLVTVSSHKIGGPKGVGALYVRKGLHFPGIIHGGAQEGGYRGGTEALPNIAGFGEAARLLKAEFSDTVKILRALREKTAELISDIPGIVFIGEGDAPHILSISLPGYKSEVIMNFLDAAGICVSKSSACKKGARSHVLEAMGLPLKVIDGAIRISFGRENTAEQVEYFAQKLKEAVSKLYKVL